MSVSILAFGAISALGEGAAAVSAGEVGAPARLGVTRDAELEAAGLARPFAARAPIGVSVDRAAALLVRALSGCAWELDRLDPTWRSRRVGLVLGTSSGGMRAAEQAFAAIERGEAVTDSESSSYMGPMAQAARSLGCSVAPCTLVLGACASSAIAIGLACRWLQRDACDLVLAGGFDEVTVFVASGFESLRATTAAPPPRPFRLGRDGLALGEGAAVLALVRNAAGARVFVTGFGMASDAMHLTAPDPRGAGLARAAEIALREAGQPHVDLVSAHATATPFNDPAEARALAQVLGSRSTSCVVHPFKAQIGHTLGAAGALELLASVDALARGVFPAAAGEGSLDAEAAVRLLAHAERGEPHVALKLASAFGGIDAALVVADRPGPPPRPLRPAFLQAVAYVDRELDLNDLALAARSTSDRLSRADPLVRLALAACARLENASAPLAGAGIVAGSAWSTLETNALFAARIRARGARAAEPRRFPYTSPNAVAGECSIAFNLTGPNFAVGGGMHAALEALIAGALLVEAGDAERVVVVAVDEAGAATLALAGPTVRSGAVALLLSASGEGALARVGAFEVSRGHRAEAPVAPGHLALLPLVAAPGPCELACASPPDAFARVSLV